MKTRVSCTLIAASLTVLPTAPSLARTSYAYFTDAVGDFGILNLKTAVATVCGTESEVLYGLAEGKTGVVYGAANSGDFYIMTANSTPETADGNIDAQGYDLGSTKSAVYSATSAGSFYKIDVSTGVGKLVGNFGIGLDDGTLSSGSATLYLTSVSTLYTVDPKTAAITTIGSTTYIFDATAVVGKTLYGADTDTLSLYTINTQTGAPTLIAPITGQTTRSALLGLTPVPSTASSSCLTAAKAGRPYRSTAHPARPAIIHK